jgi:diguanylate cyclase (GGDEF)-like protein
MLTTPSVVLAGMLNGLFVTVTALCLHHGIRFLAFMLVDLVFVVARASLVRVAKRAAASGRPYPMDAYFLVTILWCLLQGCIAFAALNVGNHALDIVAITSTIALIGPICARNYAAPRYAVLLVCLVDFPTVAGALLSGEPLMLLLLLQTPLFLLSSLAILKRFQKLSIDALMSHQESYDRARHDSLTNVLNRTGLNEALAVLNTPNSQPFVLFYLDLDGFKQVNDQFGHAAGDDLLRQVAARLRAQTRAHDILARLGGDEFVIAAVNLSPCEAAGLADSYIRRISGQSFDLEGAAGIRIGVSIGFVCAPQDGATLEDLHKNADAALYDSKRAGRGIGTHFAPKPTNPEKPLYREAGEGGAHRAAVGV